MSIKINPLNVFNIRRTTFMPDHFEYTDITMNYNLQDALTRWVEDNCKGRYFLSKSVYLDETKKYQTSLRIGFEEPKELSFFMLACPHLKYK